MNTVKVGDKVYWKSSHFRPPSLVIITGIDLCSGQGIKYGVPVDSVPVGFLPQCCLNLNNGHWAFGNTVSLIEATDKV